MPRYSRKKVINDSEVYSFLFDPRDLSRIVHYKTKVFSKKLQKIDISIYRHTWKQGDKLYKIAAQQYGNFRFWWIIALVNKISCEAELNYGDKIIVPVDYRQIIENI